MTKLYIPQVGNELKLLANWECKVFNEYRNEKVFTGLNIDTSTSKNMNVDVIFPKGTILRVERLYVRAPASSFDSITFRVVSSPIKSLNKARFWVKLMDANKIDFEEISQDMDSFTKLKDLHRHIALSKGFQNSHYLSDVDQAEVLSELRNHFITKYNNEFVIKFDVLPEDVVRTIQRKVTFRWGEENKFAAQTTELVNQAKTLFDKTNISLRILPILDGYLFSFDINADAIALDTLLGLYNVREKHHYHDKYTVFGSYLSYTNLDINFDRKSYPKLLENVQDFNLLNIVFKGETIKCKSKLELNKLFKNSTQ